MLDRDALPQLAFLVVTAGAFSRRGYRFGVEELREATVRRDRKLAEGEESTFWVGKYWLAG